jgi:pyrimidine operon attenuation protein/uracil phosphoribosyltransferase
MDAERIQRSIRRMAYCIAEEFHQNKIVLLGINDRGFAVASRMYEALATILPNGCELTRIDIDAELTKIGDSDINADKKAIIIVDDVIFSGRTMQQAVTYIMQGSTPHIVRCVALIDRGHRKYPVEPQFWGLVCPTKLMEHVHVDLKPSAELDQVILFHDAMHYVP